MNPHQSLAHINHQTGVKQTLLDHSIAVADYCRQEGEKIGLPYTMYLLGLLHDSGKASPNFQNHLMQNDQRHVNHSSAGGKYILDYLAEGRTKADSLTTEFLSYVIFSHHGLFDIVKNGEDIFEKRYRYDEDPQYNFEETILPFIQILEENTSEGLRLKEIYKIARKELVSFLNNRVYANRDQSKEDDIVSNEVNFYYHATIRLMLSILKEGDVFDSANSVTEVKIPRISEDYRQTQWSQGTKHVEEQAQYFFEKKNDSAINKARS